MRRVLAACALILAAAGARAQDERLLLDFCVNGQCYGTAFALLHEGHVLVETAALSRAQVPVDGVPGITVSGHHFVDLTALDRGSKIDLDNARTHLDLTLPAGVFGAHTVNLGATTMRMLPLSVPSAFLNYAATIASGDRSSLYLDAGLSRGAALLESTGQWTMRRGWMRGLSHFDYDDLQRLRRYTVGDQFAYSTDGLGGAVLIGGVGVTRAFDLDPYLITFPQPAIAGLLQAPGTIDVYKNGVLVAQRQAPAGPFDLAGLGIGPGANDVRVVVHDPFGGTRVLNQNFYGASNALARGLSEYAYQIGLTRPSIEQDGYRSDQPVLLARERFGLTDRVTAGYRLEAGKHLINAGPVADLRLPLGFLHLALAASRANGEHGHAESVAYQFIAHAFSVAAGAQVFSADYRRLGDENSLLRPRDARYLNLGYTPRQRFSLFFNADSAHYAGGLRQRSVGVGGNVNLGYGATLLLSLSRRMDRPGADDVQALASLTIPLGGRDSLSFNAASANGHAGYGMSAQRSLPSDTGYGYALDAQHDAGGVSGRAEFDYQGSYGRLGVIGERFDGYKNASILLSGSVIALGGRVFVARPAQTGYALVQVPELAGVEITREHLPVGRTDTAGDLLVPGLLPYQANRIGIDQASVPVLDAIGNTEILTSVPRLGGTVVRFDVHPLRAATGHLRLEGAQVAYGSLMIEAVGRTLSSPVGFDGAFYFDDLPAGVYAARLLHEGRTARCDFTVPARNKPVFDLGEVLCTPSKAASP